MYVRVSGKGIIMHRRLRGDDCCDVAVAQINYHSFKHNTQDNIEQARGRSYKEDSSQIFMLDDMQFGGGLDVI